MSIMSTTEAMSLTCAMISLSEAILLYSPPRCCASKSAPKGRARRTSNFNPLVTSSSSPSSSGQSFTLCESSVKSTNSRSYRFHGRMSRNVCRVRLAGEN
ncbi:hypothetical protein EV702DRAFT_1113807 [Suillus placidus]|uniref:Secreted protein n=1 Tax=Suillus placidus TaxID=48579 RepID=A0A9P6ZUA2_9AGAM|nr:hypothetical protein EV702DRAFT_1113807 [Suillus placidus]